LAAGVYITNSLTNDIIVEEMDFLCAAVYGDRFDDFRTADILLDENEQQIRYSVYVKPNESKYLILGFKVPTRTETAVFAYSNVWGSSYIGKSYLYAEEIK
jgi:hypothetical protein